MYNLSVWPAGEGQQTREQAHDARTEAGTHPVQICDFDMETHSGKKYTMDDLKCYFSIVMFGDSVTNHALQGLHKMQEIIAEQGGQFRICRRIPHPVCKVAKQFCTIVIYTETYPCHHPILPSIGFCMLESSSRPLGVTFI